MALPARTQPSKSPTQLRDIQQTARSLQAIRKTLAFKKNASKLFTGNNWLLTPRLATDILRLAGVPIPREVELTVSMCQLIASGGAAYSAIEAGQSINAIATPTAAAMQAFVELSTSLGWLKKGSNEVEALELGVDSALIVSSYGTNVAAWGKLVLDLATIGTSHDQALQYLATRTASEKINEIIMPMLKEQQQAAAENFKELAQGQIGMFQFIGRMASRSAEFFPVFLPELEVFFPPTYWEEIKVEATAQESMAGIPVNQRSYVAAREFIHSRLKKGWLNEILEIFVDPVLEPYLKYTNLTDEELRQFDSKLDHKNPVSRIKLETLLVMSMMPPYLTQIPEYFDARKYLAMWNLAPSDFGDDVIWEEINVQDTDLFISKYEQQIPAGVTYNGVDFFSPKVHQMNDVIQARINERQDVLDNYNNISFLLKNPTTNKMIEEWGRLVSRPYNVKFIYDMDQKFSSYRVEQVADVKFYNLDKPVRYQDVERTIYPGTKEYAQLTGNKMLSRFQTPIKKIEKVPLPDKPTVLDPFIRARNKLVAGDWRNFQNLLGALSFLDWVKRDNLIQYSSKADTYDQFVSVDRVNSMYQNVMTKMYMKFQNRQAYMNIADLLGVKPENLVHVNRGQQKVEEPAVFKVR